MTLAELTTAIYSRLAAELASPVYTPVNEDNIILWINEKLDEVPRIVKDSSVFHQLLVYNSDLTISGGSVNLPSDFNIHEAVRFGTKNAIILESLESFSKWDSGNFVMTPSLLFPVAVIVSNAIKVKPTTITSGKLDYVKKHPTVDSGNGTLFNQRGDNVLIQLVLSMVYQSLEKPELAKLALEQIVGA